MAIGRPKKILDPRSWQSIWRDSSIVGQKACVQTRSQRAQSAFRRCYQNTGGLLHVENGDFTARYSTRSSLSKPRSSLSTRSASSFSLRRKRAYLALGSNVGDRLENIERACDALVAHPDIYLSRTSSLYESAPMYVEDQGKFLNAACEIDTVLSPMELLDELQAIERDLGRIKTIDKGPRNIDLDILFYGQETVDNDRLTVPHKLMHEREFVLRPLNDLVPTAKIHTVDQKRKISEHLQQLVSRADHKPFAVMAVVPFGPVQFLRPHDPRKATRLMSILNVTPDSFSDGGKHAAPEMLIGQTIEDLETFGELVSQQAWKSGLSEAEMVTKAMGHRFGPRHHFHHLFGAISDHVRAGADIIDIGGQSSRPNAVSIGDQEEFQRILPALALRSMLFPRTATSIDTYRSKVAEGALQYAVPGGNDAHNLHIINDISGGLMEPDILRTAARSEHHPTVVLTHIRGTPETMQNPEHLHYEGGVSMTVAKELAARVQAAEEAGIRRWRIILDPGIGFAKTTFHNLKLLRDLPKMKLLGPLQGLPWLVGASRKKFIGDVLGTRDYDLEVSLGLRRASKDEHFSAVRDVEHRDWGTAATVVAAIQGGADIVRVHDVRGMRDVVNMADAMYRGYGDAEMTRYKSADRGGFFQ